MIRSSRFPLSILPLFLLCALCLSTTTHADEDIGTVDFSPVCEAAVVADFHHALGLLHHMMYSQARAGFESVIERDADCAMGYWGVATTLFQPLWGTRPSAEDMARGREQIRLARAKAGDLRERALIDATAAFFEASEGAEYGDRVKAWIEAMAKAYDSHPDDADTATLYALSLLAHASTASAQRGMLRDKAEQILRQVHDARPRHPGAIHYTIHATDAEGRAGNALDIVEAYAGIAPEVAHALHMPSHIYVRLGDWPAVIEWNQRSAEAALKHPANGRVSHHHIHALDYQLYARLQQGADRAARALVDRVDAHGRHQPTFISTYHYAAMPARLAVEQRQWRDAAALEPRTPADLPWDQSRWPEGMRWLAIGLGALHGGDIDRAREAERRLARLHDLAEEEGDAGFATYIEIDRLILAGQLAQQAGRDGEAEDLMRKAAEHEAGIDKHPVSPGALLPPNEALGDLLMALDRPEDALKAYRLSDRIWPGRYHTVLGAARAGKAAGDMETAGKYYDRLLEIAGESERDGVVEAREFVVKL